jgi:hypothetical protein
MASIQIGVLGPVEAIVDSTVATLGATKQRAPAIHGAVRSCRFNAQERAMERGIRERLEAELAHATAELKTFMATWEYAFAMAGGCHGGRDHPVHWATQARTEELAARCRELRARLAEHRL